jgi:hypothetical protein
LFSRRPDKVLQRNVVVNLLSGNAVSGVCSYECRVSLVLRGATVHEPGAEPVPADGELLIDRANVDFIQLL